MFMVGFSHIAEAQKQDNVWLFGYDYNPGDLKEGIRFSFDDSLIISYEERLMDFYTTTACISDSAGNLLLYSNGCYIDNSQGMEVAGSSGLNPGTMYNIYCADDIGYNIPMGMIALPAPENPTNFYFFHFLVNGPISKNLTFTLIDQKANNGHGSTLLKNQPIVLDTIAFDGLHAVKHANGRDWWVIAAKEYSNKYFVVLLSPDGVEVKEQIIGLPTWSGAGGQIAFSPDGSKLARFNPRDDLRIFDFDRCTGTFFNPVFISIEDDADNQTFAGLAWSADGRYLYAAEIKRILQFDMWNSDIAASKTIVAERETSLSPYLGFLELGPDGRIYGSSLGGQFFMHRINHPERGGLESEVQQSYFELEFPYANLPHFPNYRLGPIDGSPCDTLGLDNHPLAGWRYDKTGGLGVDFTSVSWYEPDTWWWDFGDLASGAANQSNERNPAHVFSAPGAYEVCLTVSNQYGSDMKCKWVWVSTVGTGSPESDTKGLRLSPNPANDLLSIRLDPDVSGQFRLVDIAGKTWAEQVKSVGMEQVDIKTREIPAGIYFLSFRSDKGKSMTQKVIIQR